MKRIIFKLGAVAAMLLAASPLWAQTKDIVDTAVGAGQFKTLAAALGAAELVDALKGSGPFTVFAPTDEAFAKLPKGTVEELLKPENKGKLAAILTYHVVPGKVLAADVVKLNGATTLNGQRVDIKAGDKGVAVDGAKVVKTDIVCSNGVIHVIDAVILPAGDPIPGVAEKAGKFKTLLAAVKAAGLAEVLSGDGPFTVFAPTDDAFAKLPKGTVEDLLKPENKDKLVAILKYHVVPGRVYSPDAVKAGKAKTLQGGELTIAVRDSNAMVNNAKLVLTDLDASNGVIHVVDTVLLPPADGKKNAMLMLERAVAEGAPLYNAGQHAECAKIYASAMQTLMSTSLEHSGLRHEMSSVLQAAQHEACPTQRAWVLRHGIDKAYTVLSRN